jgi:hypothetical protein
LALTAVGFRFFFAFFVFNLCAVLCYIFFYPETKGRTLEQMGQLFGDQLVPGALKDPQGAAKAMEALEKKGTIEVKTLDSNGGNEVVSQ